MSAVGPPRAPPPRAAAAGRARRPRDAPPWPNCGSTCWSGTCSGSSRPTWARRPGPGATRRWPGEHALIVEVAPALAIERVTDLALRAVPAVEPGILFVERQFGVLEVHGPAWPTWHGPGRRSWTG